MPFLYITEYESTAMSGSTALAVGLEPSLVTQKLEIGPLPVVSAPFQPATRFVRLHADESCSLTFGIKPDATNGEMRLAMDATEFFGVEPGLSIAVIVNED